MRQCIGVGREEHFVEVESEREREIEMERLEGGGNSVLGKKSEK